VSQSIVSLPPFLPSSLPSFLLSFLPSTIVWTQSLRLARETLYHLNYALSPFCVSYFSHRVYFLLEPTLNCDLPTQISFRGKQKLTRWAPAQAPSQWFLPLVLLPRLSKGADGFRRLLTINLWKCIQWFLKCSFWTSSITWELLGIAHSQTSTWNY
jgi:hypothetical protein